MGRSTPGVVACLFAASERARKAVEKQWEKIVDICDETGCMLLLTRTDRKGLSEYLDNTVGSKYRKHCDSEEEKAARLQEHERASGYMLSLQMTSEDVAQLPRILAKAQAPTVSINRHSRFMSDNNQFLRGPLMRTAARKG